MSMSVGSSPVSTNQPTYVDSQDNGRVNVRRGDQSEELDVEQFNAAYAARGLQATRDGFQYNGVPVTSSNERTMFSSTPDLPEVRGPQASPRDVGDRAAWLQEIEDGSLMWMAMRTMAEGAQREMHDAFEVRQEMHRGKAAAKEAEINATEQKIEAERDAAGWQLGFQIASAATSFATSAMNSPTGGAWDRGFSAASGAIGQSVSAAGQYWSKNSGPQATADARQLDAMRAQAQQETFDQNIDSSRQSYDAAREQFKQALKIVQDHVEAQSQVVQRITSG